MFDQVTQCCLGYNLARIAYRKGSSLTANHVNGQVTALNEAGDLLTDIAVSSCATAPNPLEVKIRIGPHETLGIHPATHNEPEGTLIAIASDEGLLNISITGMNISEMLGIPVGQKVTVSW